LLTVLLLLAALAQPSCGDDAGSSHTPDLQEDDSDMSGVSDVPDVAEFDRGQAPGTDGIYGFANGCYAVEGFDGFAAPAFVDASDDGTTFAFTGADAAEVSRFHMRATDLGSYLLYDSDRHYLIAEDTADVGEEPAWLFGRVDTLESDILLLDDTFVSPAEWVVEVSVQDAERFQLTHYQTGRYLALDGLTEDEADAAVISFFEQEGCAEFPELTVDATGAVESRQWEDGDLWGIADTHEHMMSNFAFGGGGVFHGAPYHRLGVEHALGSCEPYHGEEGRRDLIGLFYDRNLGLDVDALIPIITSGQSEDFNHFTAGYPEFIDWPNAGRRATHQTLYYRWIERAYLSGLRLFVQHVTGNSVLCEFVTGMGGQVRYSCNDMVTIDRSIEEVRNLERYIDAQSGGPGQGWFRVVDTPEQARDVINEGQMAVVLGIEISNLFDCFVTPREEFDVCDGDSIRDDLDRYYDLGVRVIFPVHKFDNGFGAGDGNKGIIELGNFINSGQYSNFVEDCPGGASGFDRGNLSFGGLNQPREVYDSPPPVDMRGFAAGPIGALLPYLSEIQEGSLEGNFCQNAGMTDLGETLIDEMLQRGMIVDIAHLSQRGVLRALEILEESDYPALSTHSQTYDGRLYEIGGMSHTGFGGCGDTGETDTMGNGFRSRIQQRIDNGAYPGEGFGFDFNGFAHSRRPRFGESSPCSQPQPNPITYPFTSYDGDIEFQEPQLGSRAVDFNTEGMIHIGLLPELIEDVRRDGMSDEDLEPLFRSAESFVRMWERAEERAAELSE
jgi:microsomal dipeptidase-like Zn-dependent dipeptidase